MTDSFKLVPKQIEPLINPMLPRQASRPPSDPPQTKQSQSRKIFIGAIGTELTSRELIKAFKAIDVDIVNKPVRILRGKKFNFAPGVEVKTDAQLKKVIAIKRLEVEGSILEIRPHQPNRKKKVAKRETKTTMKERPRDSISIERTNKLKLKLYELKLMEAENLLMKAKIDSEIRTCQEGLEKEKRRRSRTFSRSYGDIAKNRMDSVSFQSINFDQSLTQAQKQYLKRFQRTRAIQVEPEHPLAQRMVYLPERSISQTMRGTKELEQRLNNVLHEFYPTTSKFILDQEPRKFSKKNKSSGAMDISSKSSGGIDISGWTPSLSPTDPPLVENMGSLQNGSLDNVFREMEGQKIKKIQMEFANLDKKATNPNMNKRRSSPSTSSNPPSQILLLVKDDIAELVEDLSDKEKKVATST